MGEKLKAFPQRSGTRQGCQLLPLLLNISTGVLARVIRKEMKDIQIGKEVKWSVCRWHNHVYRKPYSTKTVESSKFAGHENQHTKISSILYTNRLLIKEINNPIYNSKKNKIFSNKFNQKFKDLYT